MLKGMSNIYKQAQKMQKNMEKVQDELIKLEVDGQSGGGMVKVVVNGKKEPISVSMNEDIFKEDILVPIEQFKELFPWIREDAEACRR